ncbi:GspH/FimT family protein [Tissierella sp. MSJ-40]|uniref:GspH/FimT family protein n=1 Tax=Tissierella simiarum TaxID=2841534 RepID=A0ABS6E4Z9_9FIRM|nr:competence type IV pilus minor pilin ComGD [Tissierella simiarum]MBU5437515.1 GspH/FimT family protein [Tissierella simiarum]
MNGIKGFTLIELILVLALLSLFLVIGLPNIKYITYMKEKQELREFKRDIAYARNNAIVQRKIYNLTIDQKNNGYIIIKADKIPVIVKDVSFKYGTIVLRNNFNNSINFYPTGSPSVGGTIYLTNSKKESIKITITPATGKINFYIN